jgi:predicted dehydrogenase
MNRVRTALIGCGKVGQTHAQALAALPESEFVAVCDVDPERAGSFVTRYHVKPYTEVDRMLAVGSVQAVCIATPHPLHAEPAIQAARAGAHVLVEKPLAASLSDCDLMLAATRSAGTKLGVISQRRWYEPVQRMKAAIDAGKIGRPVLGVFTMYSWRSQAYYQSDPWRGKWDTEGGGVLVNQSPHMIDLLCWMMNDEVETVGGYWANGASVGVETDRGATYIAGVSTIAEPPLNDLWTIPGEEASLVQFEAVDRARFAAVDVVNHYHALQIRDFLRSIIDDRPPLVTGDDGRRVVALFEAIYHSSRDGRSIKPA